MRIRLLIACVCVATPSGEDVSQGCEADNVDLLQAVKHSALTGSTWHTIAAAVSKMRAAPSSKKARHSPELVGLEKSMSQLAGNVISGREEMSKGIKDIADAVRAEMAKIVGEVENGEKQALQDQIDNAVAAFDECAAPGAIDDQFETAAGSKETAHSDCRSEEKRLKSVAANKQGTYDEKFPASPPSCNSNFVSTYATPATLEQIDTFTVCVQKTADWWSAYKSNAVPAANAYKTAATAHTNKTAECNRAQATFETTYCSYAVHFEDTCGAYTRCYTAKSSAFQNMTTDVQILETTHKRLFTSAKHITCLLNLLEDTSKTDKQTLLDNCVNEQIDTSSVEVTMKSAPAAADCHKDTGTIENPGEQGFAAKFYDPKDWHDDAPVQAQVECVIPVSAPTTTEASSAGQTQCPDEWVQIEGKCYSPPEKTSVVLVGKPGMPPGADHHCQNLDPSAQIMTREEAEAYLASPLGADDPCEGTGGCGSPLGMTYGYTRTIQAGNIWFTNHGWYSPSPDHANRWFVCVKS